MTVDVDVNDGVMLITLNRPSTLNALDANTLDELVHVARQAAERRVRSLVVTGSGRGFCSGVDIRETADEARYPELLRTRFNPFVLAFRALGKPLVAAINGVTAGAGIALAMMCDVRLGTPQTRLVPAFIEQGLVPDAGTTFFTVEKLGYDRAFRFLLTESAPVTAQAALEQGILTDVVDARHLLSTALATARMLASGEPEPTHRTIQLLRRSVSNSLAQQLDDEASAQNALLEDQHLGELRRSIREAVGSSRRPLNV